MLERLISWRLRNTPSRSGCFAALLRGLSLKSNGDFSSGPSGRTDLAVIVYENKQTLKMLEMLKNESSKMGL